jgi:hypothetical protein
MGTSTIVAIIVSLLLTLLCAGSGLLMLFLVVGVMVLRRRGRKANSAKEIVSVGVESVSQVFMRTGKGLEPVDDDDKE